MVLWMMSVLVFFHVGADFAESGANPPALPPTFQYSTVPCASNTPFLEHQIIKLAALPTEAMCAYQCYLDFDCRHAIFVSGRIESCYLASNAKDEDTSISEFTNLSSGFCSILKINPRIRCAGNGNVPEEFSCSCAEGYFGRYCEEVVISFCEANEWIKLETFDYFSIINSSEFQVKFRIQIERPEGTDFEIQNVDDVFIVPAAPEKLCEFHSLLAWNVENESFVMPPQMAFRFTSHQVDNMVTEYLSLEGVLLDIKIEYDNVTSAVLLMEDPTNTERLSNAFHDDAGSYERLANGLSKGHRLVHREPIRVEFDSLNMDVVFESLAGASLVRHDNFQVRVYETYKQTFKDFKRFVAEFVAANGSILYDGMEHHYDHVWALDDCWGPLLQQIDDADELTGILRETLLNGKDVRIVMGDSTSSDVLQVTITDKEVVAALAPYIAPLDSVSKLGIGNAFYSLISTHKILTTCEMKYQAGEVVQRDTVEYLSPVQWIISKRTWKKVYVMNNYGNALFGDTVDLYQVALLGKNFRVCVKYSDVETTCFGVKALTLKSISYTVLMQSRSAIRPAFNGDGLLNGVEDNECRRTELLLSSEGWVKSVVYTEGNVNYEYDDNVEFETMTWFVENR